MIAPKYTIVAVFLIGSISFGQNTAELKEINNQVWMKFSEAFKTLDADLFGSLHHKDFIRLSGEGKQIKYKETYIEGYKNRWQNKNIHQKISFRFLERFLNAKHASERGIYKLTINPGTEGERSYYGKFHVVLIKTDGIWQLMVDYDSSENDSINEQSYREAHDQDALEKF